jgi:dTDP-glucose 4,6-dehydratase
MSILVIGGCGFIGSHLVEELLNRGKEVQIIGFRCQLENLESIKEKVKFIRVDVRDRDAINKVISSDIEGVLHLAALINVDESVQSPAAFFDTNVTATVGIMEAVRNKKIPKLTYMSTCEVYGNTLGGKADENHPTNPRSPYAASKFAAERYLLAYSYTYDEPRISIIRGFNQYGPRQSAGQGGAVIPKFITKLLNGQKIQVQGDGSQTRDYVYVKDTVKGIADVFEKDLPPGEVVNLATGVETSVKDIAEAVCRLAGKEPEKYIEFVKDRPGQLMRSCGDYSKAKKLIGWEPKVPFKEGLSLTFDWYAGKATK